MIMASRHRRPAAKPLAFGAAGAGLVGALVLTGPAPAALFNAAANTLIVVGGNGDPTSQQEWDRIGGSYAGTEGPVLISYPADVGVRFGGFPPLSIAGRDTYAGSVDKGSTTTADAITAGRADGGDVTVYALSLGTDVVGVALVKAGPKKDTDGKLTVIKSGSPSFVNSGIWNSVPPMIPGLRNGPVAQGAQGSGADKVVSVCIKGDSICGLGTDPIPAVFYFLPGFDLHGKDYSAEKIAKYSPSDGTIELTPGAAGVTTAPKDGAATIEYRDGRPVTVQRYQDGTVTRTWEEDGTTWVVIDTGENPWGRLARANGIPLPMAFDKVLSAVMPVPEPGQRGALSQPMALWQRSAVDAQAAIGAIGERVSGEQGGAHSLGAPGTVPWTTMLDGSGTVGDTDDTARQAPPVQTPAAPEPAEQELAEQDPAEDEPAVNEALLTRTEVENDQQEQAVTHLTVTQDEQPAQPPAEEIAPVDPPEVRSDPVDQAGTAATAEVPDAS